MMEVHSTAVHTVLTEAGTGTNPLPIFKALQGLQQWPRILYKFAKLFCSITGLNICNLDLVSGWSRAADPARASRGAGRKTNQP